MAEPSVTRDDRPSSVSCDDFSLFQDVIKKMRIKDDRIAHAMNTTIPTESFAGKINAAERCKSLYEELQLAHSQRVDMIKQCINVASDKVEVQRQARKVNMDDIEVLKNLRKEQSKLRQLQSELYVEEIVMDQSNKVFYERCRNHYIPPNFKQ